jgi:hypothetical protein
MLVPPLQGLGDVADGFPALTGRANMGRPSGPWDRRGKRFFDKINGIALKSVPILPAIALAADFAEAATSPKTAVSIP